MANATKIIEERKKALSIRQSNSADNTTVDDKQQKIKLLQVHSTRVHVMFAYCAYHHSPFAGSNSVQIQYAEYRSAYEDSGP